MAEKLLELRDVSMSFGGLTVIDDLDLHVDEGEIVSVIGPNGAGKTTLFNLITGVYEPTTGDIVFDGQEHHGTRAAPDHPRGIARTFQTLRLFLNMTRARERDGRRVRPHEGGRLPLDAAHAGDAPGGAGDPRSSPRSGSRSSASG